MAKTSRASSLSGPAAWALLAVLAAFLLAAYGNDLRAQRGRQESRWPNGKLRTRGEALRYPDGRVQKEGPYAEFYQNGALHLKGRYHRGKAEGLWREYDPRGRLLKEGSYRQGKADGLWRYHHPDRSPEQEELLWDEGRVVENGRRVPVDTGPAPPRFSWPRHLLGVAWTLLWLLSPLPLLFLFLREGGDTAGLRPEGKDRAGTGPGSEDPLSGSRGGLASSASLSAVEGVFAACDSSEDGASQLVALSVGWAVVQLSLLLILALAGALAAVPFLAGQASILIGGGIAWLRRGRPVPCLGIVSAGRRDPVLAALAAAFIILTLAVLVKTLLVPMSDWDGLAYHLPLMAQWLQAHRLVDVPALGQTARYPSSFEVLSLGGYFPFTEDLLFTLPAVGSWVLLGLSVFALSRRLGAALEEAAAAALFLLSLPLTLLQTEELKADLPLAALFLSALVLGGLFAGKRSRVRWSLFWLALALLFGMKASGGAYALLAVAAVGWWRWHTRRTGRDGNPGKITPAAASPRFPEGESSGSSGMVPRRRRALLFSLAWALFLAVFWYARNLFELGNPLGHVQFSLLGHTIFPGAISRAELWHTTFFALFRPFHTADWQVLLEVEKQWLGLGMAVLLVSAVVALVRGWSRPGERGSATLLFLLLAAGGILFGITPFSGDNGSHGWRITPWVGQALRYGLPKLAVLAVVAAWGWRSLRLPRWSTAALAAGLCAWSTALRVALPRTVLDAVVVLGAILSLLLLFWPGPETSAGSKGRQTAPETSKPASSISGSGKAKAGAFSLAGIGSHGRSLLRATALIMALALLAGASRALREGRETRRRILYDLPYLHTLTAPKDEVVGVAMTQLRYPFYGHDLKRRVIDVSDHDLPKEVWLRRLDEEKVDIVAAGPRPVRRTFAAPERDLHPWLEDPAGPFAALPGVGSESGEGIVLYRYRRMGDAPSAAEPEDSAESSPREPGAFLPSAGDDPQAERRR